MSFGATAFGLADVLRAESQQKKSNSNKGLIQVFLGGGPPHQDMWEIKTDAPSEIRGEFRPIPTNVPGIQICEVFPKLARLMDKAAIIRSIVGCKDRHESYQCLSGWIPEVGIDPRKSIRVCSFTAALVPRNFAHGNNSKQRSIVVESRA